MDFTSAAAVETVAWQMRLADWPRAQNRAKLNEIYNGIPPYTEREAQENGTITNVNFLEGTKILHDARRQFANAFQTANELFTVEVDYGPVWKRREWGSKITRELNKRVKASRRYLDTRDSVFASVVLHGVGPSGWMDKESWCPHPYGIEDVLVPSNTLVSLENLPFFVVYRQYTAFQLYKLTHGPKVDPAWNLPLVEQALHWADAETQKLSGTTWPEVWSPEKMEERIKQDGGLYASDAVPTIDVLDMFFWSDEGRQSGWRRRMVLDAWGNPGVGGAGGISVPSIGKGDGLPDKNFLGTRNQFLYNPGKRKYADKTDEIIHFQFADCSCVAPFRYHSVRSLGFLCYAVCHLQNRLRCKFNDATFESLLQYFRVTNPADAERLTKIDLIDKGVIPEGLEFVKQADRWQVPAQLAENVMALNRQTMADNSASFTQDFDFGKEDEKETATRTMAKVNATAALVGAMLNKAYNQQQFQYQEIARRFCRKQSKDSDVRRFRVECLKADVPLECLNVERWNVQPVRVIGSGNKMMQVAMADKLWAIRQTLDPDAQRTVSRIYILANSDDPALAEQLVPEMRHVSDSVHDAQAVLGTILKGLPVALEEGMNHAEYVEVWLHAMASLLQRVEQRGGMATEEELIGFGNLGQHIQQQLAVLAQEKNNKAMVKKYGDELGQMMNLVKGYAQRLQEQRQKMAQQGGGGIDAEGAVKLKTQMALAQSKIRLASESHAQKTAQRQIAFEQQMQQDNQRHALELAKRQREEASNMAMTRLKSFSE